MEDKSRDELRAAKGRVAAHRVLLRENLAAARARVAPSELKRDVVFKLRRLGSDTKLVARQTAKDHPYALGTAVVATAAYALRRPIARLSPRLGAWIHDRYDAVRARLTGDDAGNASLTERLVRRMNRGTSARDIEGD
ncbi:MAG: hypothetical protein GW859_03310 [Sphingomonadales bacterium]|nr:hypothetical protein [Sphingomonadales bacterium]